MKSLRLNFKSVAKISIALSLFFFGSFRLIAGNGEENVLEGIMKSEVTESTEGRSLEKAVLVKDHWMLTGRVTDEKGEPVIRANVSIKGTTIGTATDFDGNFSLEVKKGDVLVVSYIGYINYHLVITNQETLIVKLKEDTKLLEEVVVVGYGTQKKINLTGAVSNVDVNKTLGGRPIPDVGRGLQGSTPGLTVVNRNGEIGSDPLIKIRGQLTSIQGGSKPLILLDNVEIPSIQLVNPNDIESISILKDAASASIYGAKGAFGVILITTKQGTSADRVDVTFSSSIAWQNPAKKLKIGGVEALEYAMDAIERVGGTKTGAFFKVSRESLERTYEWLEKYGHLGPNDPTVYGRDWYVSSEGDKMGVRIYDPTKYMIKEWTPTYDNNLSVNGKSGKISYNFGIGYLDQSGMVKPAKKDDFRRQTATLRLTSEINKYLTLKGGTILSKRQKRFSDAIDAKFDPWYYLYRWGPNYPYGYSDRGYPLRGAVQEVAQANTDVYTKNYSSVNIGAIVNFTKNWNLNFDYAYSNNEFTINAPGTRYSAEDVWSNPVPRLDSNGNPVFVNKDGVVVGSDVVGAMPAYDFDYREYTGKGSGADMIFRSSENTKRKTLNAYTTYHENFNDIHDIKIMLGINRVTYDEVSIWGRKKELVDIFNPQFDLAIGDQKTGGYSGWESQLGYYGRINYSFKDRYLLEANLRYDGTSKFPKDLRWRWFPSFSVGWRLSEETFMKWSRSVLDQLKLRVSWGTIGDQTVLNSLYVPTMDTSMTSWLSSAGKKFVTFNTPGAISSNITWQDIETLDLGFDLRMLNNSLGFTFDWYRRNTENMIVPGTPVPSTFGTGAPKGNFGNLRTNGWELAIDFNHRFNNGLRINVTATISDAVTKITQYENDVKSLGTWSWYEGKRYGDIWGYATDRLYQKEDFVWENGKMVTTWALKGKEVPAGTPGAKKMNKLADPNGIYQDYFQKGNFVFGPGDVKFIDLNGDGEINNGTYTEANHGDLKIIGNFTPRYEYGLRLGVDYGGVDFSIFFQGVGKRSIWGNGMLVIPGFFVSNGAMPDAIVSDYWKEDRTNAFYPRAWEMSGESEGYNMQVQTRYLLDMSYLRIKNITLGYTLPDHLVKYVGLNSVRFYTSIENFLTFDKLRGLPVDPEIDSSYNFFNYSNSNLGRTGMSSPVFKSVSLGLQINF